MGDFSSCILSNLVYYHTLSQFTNHNVTTYSTGLSDKIITPYSLPMFRENKFLFAKRRKDKARKDPQVFLFLILYGTILNSDFYLVTGSSIS